MYQKNIMFILYYSCISLIWFSFTPNVSAQQDTLEESSRTDNLARKENNKESQEPFVSADNKNETAPTSFMPQTDKLPTNSEADKEDWVLVPLKPGLELCYERNMDIDEFNDQFTTPQEKAIERIGGAGTLLPGAPGYYSQRIFRVGIQGVTMVGPFLFPTLANIGMGVVSRGFGAWIIDYDSIRGYAQNMVGTAVSTLAPGERLMNWWRANPPKDEKKEASSIVHSDGNQVLPTESMKEKDTETPTS